MLISVCLEGAERLKFCANKLCLTCPADHAIYCSEKVGLSYFRTKKMVKHLPYFTLKTPPKSTALLKQAFSDFMFKEDLGYEMSGEGEFVAVKNRKTDFNTLFGFQNRAGSYVEKSSNSFVTQPGTYQIAEFQLLNT